MILLALLFATHQGQQSEYRENATDRAFNSAVQRLDYAAVKRSLDGGQRFMKPTVFTLLERKNEDKKVEILKLFVKRGLTIDPLIGYAAQFSNPRVLKFLLERGDKRDGDDPETQSIEWRPIYYAILYNEDECVRLLLEYGEDPNVVCKGWTLGSGNPLHLAAYNNMVGKMKILLKYGAKLELVGRSGDTPLLSAVLKPDNVDAVKFLLSKGANRNAKNRLGETALDVARRKKYAKLVKLLEGK